MPPLDSFPIDLVGAGAADDLVADEEVRHEVEAALIMAGYPDTPEGYSQFQRDHGLPVTGAFDPETLDRLGAEI